MHKNQSLKHIFLLGGGRGGGRRGSVGGRRGGGRGRSDEKPRTAEELDAELDDYINKAPK